MAAGELKCIGPVQELKDTFGLGFVIALALKPGVSDDLRKNVKDKMTDTFNCKIREEYGVSS